MLFQNALQTNPGCRPNLTIEAFESSNPDSNRPTELINVARNELPKEAHAIHNLGSLNGVVGIFPLAFALSKGLNFSITASSPGVGSTARLSNSIGSAQWS